MIKELFPRAHVRLALLPLLGPLLEGFAAWLVGKGLSRNSTRARIQKAPAFEMVLSRHGDFDAKRLFRDQLLTLGPPRARDDIRMSSLVQSLADYLGDPTVADSILDRLVHHAHYFELSGDSLRKQRGREILGAGQDSA